MQLGELCVYGLHVSQCYDITGSQLVLFEVVGLIIWWDLQHSLASLRPKGASLKTGDLSIILHSCKNGCMGGTNLILLYFEYMLLFIGIHAHWCAVCCNKASRQKGCGFNSGPEACLRGVFMFSLCLAQVLPRYFSFLPVQCRINLESLSSGFMLVTLL